MIPEAVHLSKIIRPGDILLYDRSGWMNAFIRFKRGEKFSHAAIASQPGFVLEAIQGDVLDERPIRWDGLAGIYRLTEDFDYEAGYDWFLTVRGQGYDWVGLLSFAFAKFQGRTNHKMFCSEFVARFFAKLGRPLFSPITDADAVSPGMIPYSPFVKEVWVRPDKRKGSQ